MTLISPVPTGVLAVARGLWDNRRLSGPGESIRVNRGGPSVDGNESGSTHEVTHAKSSDASEGSQRGHRTQNTGKPYIGGRATA
jgi:hypothetical protein